MSLKFTEKLCVITIKNNEKFGEELISCFKIDMMNVMNFDSSTQNFNFNELFLIKIYNI